MNISTGKCLIDLGSVIARLSDKLDALSRKIFAAGAKKILAEAKKGNPTLSKYEDDELPQDRPYDDSDSY